MAPPALVVLAFRYPLVALGIRAALATCDDLQIAAECSTAHGTVKALKRLQPCVLLVGTGICDQGHGVLDLLDTLRAASPKTSIAVFCTHDGALPGHALLQGAGAVLPPESEPAQVVDAIRTLLQGRRWRVRFKRGRNAARRRNGPQASESSALAVLSARERQIAEGVAVGKRNREIAEAFGISPGTVKLHLNRIYGKLGVNSRLALLRKIIGDVARSD